jgi:FKBP-type peptidyl-prolyl cis-trans isomerase
MKRTIFIVLAFALAIALPLSAQAEPATPAGDPSYALGMLLAGNIKSAGLAINYDVFMAAMKDVLEGSGAKLTEAQAQAVVQAAVQAASAKKAGESQARGLAFLAANRDRPGVKVTASGLQYEVLSLGTGAMPVASDTVTVNYEGRLMDGTVFDSSYARGEPTTFRLDEVIPGWTEGVQLMPTGSKYRFYMPSELAYGARGAGGVIGPNEVLIFDVELISFTK